MPIDTSGVNRWVEPSRWLRKVTPSSSTWARRSLSVAMTSAASDEESIDSVLRNPAPRLMTWKPPESVKVGPDQPMNRPSPPASSTTSSPGWRYRW